MADRRRAPRRLRCVGSSNTAALLAHCRYSAERAQRTPSSRLSRCHHFRRCAPSRGEVCTGERHWLMVAALGPASRLFSWALVTAAY